MNRFLNLDVMFVNIDSFIDSSILQGFLCINQARGEPIKAKDELGNCEAYFLKKLQLKLIN